MTQSTIKNIKNTYKAGERVFIRAINDPFVSLETDTLGTIQRVDDIGTVHVELDNGTIIGLIYGIDSFHLA